ncbi:MAG: DinB family protein, partial [Tepidiformaceae bacterium]
CLDRWTPSMLDDPFELPRAGGSVVTVTRQWLIWRVLHHDIHHTGEISLTLGAHGLPGLDM